MRDIQGVEPITKESGSLRGIMVTFKNVRGLTVPALQRIVDCHLARNAALGHDVPEMVNCPLVPRVKATVLKSDAGITVKIVAEDDAAATALQRCSGRDHRSCRAGNLREALMVVHDAPKDVGTILSRDEIERPVLVSEIIGREGSRLIHFRVFCTRKEASVQLDTCRACPALREVDGERSGKGACVRCKRQIRDPTCAPGATPDGGPDTRTPDGGPTGTLLKAAIFAVRDDMALDKLRSYFVEQSISSVYVVDESNRLVGVVRDIDFLLPQRRPRPEVAAQVMGPTPCVRENTGVRSALLEMARAGQRRTAVVTPDGVLLGVIDDVTGLKWLVGRQ